MFDDFVPLFTIKSDGLNEFFMVLIGPVSDKSIFLDSAKYFVIYFRDRIILNTLDILQFVPSNLVFRPRSNKVSNFLKTISPFIPPFYEL